MALHTNAKSTKKLIEEAALSGELFLSNCKLRDLAICCESDSDLSDVTHVSCSKNCLSEVPLELCEWFSIKSLNLSHNCIKGIPDFFSNFCLLEVLDLSNNMLSSLPSGICELKGLIVLEIQNNNILTLPQTIGKLKKCQKFNASGNTLKNLPVEMGDMSSLLHLDVSRNSLSTLPCELSKLGLVYLNASGNNISTIPIQFNDMISLYHLFLQDNPVISPSLKVLKKGRIHLFKSITNDAQKNYRPHDIIEPVLPQSQSPLKMKSLQRVHSSSENDSIILVPDSMNEDNAIKQEFINEQSQKEEEWKTQNTKPDPTIISEKQAIKAEIYVGDQSDKDVDINNQNTITSISQSRSAPVELKSPLLPSVENIGIAGKNDFSPPRQKVFDFPGYTPTSSSVVEHKQVPHSGTPEKAHFLEVVKPRTAYLNRKRQKSLESEPLSFTMRRKTEKIYEELELLENLRISIESNLKMPLPSDLLPALADGVVLCHLANHVKSRSISTIHVPSPAVPKLSWAKCRRNVENFLAACVKIGVAESSLCNATDIMNCRGLVRIVSTVTDLLKKSNVSSSENAEPTFSSPAVRIAPSSQ